MDNPYPGALGQDADHHFIPAAALPVYLDAIPVRQRRWSHQGKERDAGDGPKDYAGGPKPSPPKATQPGSRARLSAHRPRMLDKALSSSCPVTNPWNLLATRPSASSTKVNGSDGSPHSSISGESRPFVMSPPISDGLS